MKVTVDMNEDLVAAIDHAARIQKIPRDAAFSDALVAWVILQPKIDRCPIDVLKFEFDSDYIPFEIYRPGPEAMPEYWWPEARAARGEVVRGEADDEVSAGY